MMTQTAELADGIRLTKRQAQVLEAVVSEHAETRRAVPIMIVQAYCNARSVADQNTVLAALARLRAGELIQVEGEAILPVPGCMERIRLGASSSDAATSPPARDECAGDATPMQAPPVRPKSRDTLRPRQQAAPKPVTRPQPEAPRPDHDLKTCRHCDVTFRRPDAAPIPRDRCERCHDEIEAILPADAEPEVEGDGTGEALPPVADYPVPVERIHLEDGITISAELLDRCAAMHLSLLEQAREAYVQGDEAAGRELQWLIDTGEKLVAAGGAS